MRARDGPFKSNKDKKRRLKTLWLWKLYFGDPIVAIQTLLWFQKVSVHLNNLLHVWCMAQRFPGRWVLMSKHPGPQPSPETSHCHCDCAGENCTQKKAWWRPLDGGPWELRFWSRGSWAIHICQSTYLVANCSDCSWLRFRPHLLRSWIMTEVTSFPGARDFSAKITSLWLLSTLLW